MIISFSSNNALEERYGLEHSRKKAKKRQDRPSQDVMIHDEEQVWFGQEEPASQATHEQPSKTSKMRKIATNSSGWSAVRLAEESTLNTPAPPVEPSIESRADLRPQAGLMSREQLRAQREARKAAEQAAAEARVKNEAPVTDEQETIYRDAQGRRIDLAEEEALLREAEKERARKEVEKKQWNRGLVQRREDAEREAELLQLSTERVSRYVHMTDSPLDMLMMLVGMTIDAVMCTGMTQLRRSFRADQKAGVLYAPCTKVRYPHQTGMGLNLATAGMVSIAATDLSANFLYL